MRTDRNRALELRLEGKSYREIKKILGVSISTLSDWLKDNPDSKKVFEMLQEKHKGLSRAKLLKMHEAWSEIRKMNESRIVREAEVEFEQHKANPLFVAGLCLYWGEGDKRNRSALRISNTDPGIIALFRHFLIEICGADKGKIKSWLLLYPDLSEEYCKRYWIAAAGLDSANFTKSIIIKGRHKTRKVAFGVCYTGISSKATKLRVLTWLRLLPRDLLKMRA